MLSFKTDEKQSRKNLKIDKDGVAALRARQMNLMQMNPMRGGGNLSGPWGGPMPPGLGSLAAGMMGQPLNQQNPPMGNPFSGPFLMSPQGQMIGPRSTKKGGGFTPGYDPWSLRINHEVAEKLKDQPVGLFF